MTQIYAMQDGGIPLRRRFFGYAAQDNDAIFFKFWQIFLFKFTILPGFITYLKPNYGWLLPNQQVNTEI